MHRAFNPWYATMRSIVFRHPVIPICSCRIMDKPDGSGPSDTRSIRVRNIKSLLQVAFKIAIHFIMRNRGVSSHESRLWCPLFSFLPSHIKIKKCYKNPFRSHFFSSFPICFHTSFLLFFHYLHQNRYPTPFLVWGYWGEKHFFLFNNLENWIPCLLGWYRCWVCMSACLHRENVAEKTGQERAEEGRQRK